MKNVITAVPRQHGPWRILASETTYSDPWITLRRDEVLRPDGAPGTYAIVDLKPGVCVIAIDDQNFVYLTKEFHYAVGRTTTEGVSGGIENGHDALETAHRELQEELGIAAESMSLLGTTDPFTGSVRSPTALYVARGLTFGTASPEATEQIECIKMPLSDAVKATFDGMITHAPTCIILLRLALLNPTSDALFPTL